MNWGHFLNLSAPTANIHHLDWIGTVWGAQGRNIAKGTRNPLIVCINQLVATDLCPALAVVHTFKPVYFLSYRTLYFGLLWPVLSIYVFFLANSRTSWLTFAGLNQCDGVPKLTNMRYAAMDLVSNCNCCSSGVCCNIIYKSKTSCQKL